MSRRQVGETRKKGENANLVTTVPFGGYNFYANGDKKKSESTYGLPGKRRYDLNPQLDFLKKFWWALGIEMASI